MRKRLKQAAVVFIAVFAAAQLARPEGANPKTDPSRTIQPHMAKTSRLDARSLVDAAAPRSEALGGGH